ncbi:TetR/AcrR family transcriptional regulator [Galactobacter sp.]|uniref:TetR/AcrR family transcriptional regulator n=1 Tax=Galactobacter sp. TaxID=2676125 RepID=UPI0025C1E789|nr:TetR/AcrR family transcriptional regulator [Galactobacter sp.]
MSRSEQILDTYVSLLVDGGVRQATIEAVARKSGLSKPGLLHHFPSRAALDTALISRLRVLVKLDVAAMAAAPDGAVHYYLASSLEVGSDLERAVVAVTRLGQAGNANARAELRAARDEWFDLLLAQLGNPVMARLALLAGDGVAYQADITEPGSAPYVDEADVEEIAEAFVSR